MTLVQMVMCGTDEIVAEARYPNDATADAAAQEWAREYGWQPRETRARFRVCADKEWNYRVYIGRPDGVYEF